MSDADFALNPQELYWRDHYNWLLQQGYRLRARYAPDWVPSWKGKDPNLPIEGEDTKEFIHPEVTDAREVSTDRHVVLKRTSKKDNPEEVKILRYFSQPEMASDPRNHCVPLFGVLQPPDDEEHEIFVMPILRQYDDPKFDTVGEAVDFIRQVIEGFTFLHEHRVAHRDVKGDNILMDPTALDFPPFHFCSPWRSIDDTKNVHAKYSRTQRRPKYYITDFGFSTQYSEDMTPWPPMEPPKAATDLSLPELKSDKPCDPFAVDVYYVGNWMRMEFIDGDPDNPVRPGFDGSFDFLGPLIESMTKKEPKDRITIAEALQRLEEIVSDRTTTFWSTLKLRSRPKGKNTRVWIDVRFARAVMHYVRTLTYIAQRRPAIPVAGPVAPPVADTAEEVTTS